MSRESLYHIDNSVVFKETFNNYPQFLKNRGEINNDLQWNGDGTINVTGISSNQYCWQNITPVNARFSHRIRFRLGSGNVNQSTFFNLGVLDQNSYIGVRWASAISKLDFFANFDGSFLFSYSNSTYNVGDLLDIVIVDESNTSRKMYVNGILEATITPNKTQQWGFDVIGYGIRKYNTVVNQANLDNLDICEIYNRALTAEEVSALYKSNLYSDLNYTKDVSVSVERGFIESNVDVTNNGVSIIKNGYQSIMSFDDTSTNYINLTNKDFNTGTDDFSISFWMNSKRIGNTSYRGVMGNWGMAPYWYIRNEVSNTTSIQFGTTSGSSLLSASSTLSENKWYHITYTVDRSGYVKVYINGKYDNQEDISSLVGVTLSNNNTHSIGHIGSTGLATYWYNGFLSDIRMYKKKILTAEEIARIYNSTKKNYLK
jgi:hypothetical protein